MKYGYYCKRCGYSFLSNDKAEVKQAKKNHRIDVGLGVKVCPLLKTDHGTRKRPSLLF